MKRQLVKKITTKIISNGVNESVFTIIHNTELETYIIENFYMYNLHHHLGILMACIISLIVYNIINNVVAIIILLAIFSLTQIL